MMFGSGGVFVRTLTANGIDSTTLLFLRFSIAIIPILIAILLSNKKFLKIELRDFPLFIICGISIVGLNLCYNEAIESISLSMAAVLLSLAPIYVLVIAYIIFGERITKNKLVCMVLAIIGSVLMTSVLETNISNVPSYGILMGIASGVFWAIYLMASKKAMENENHTFTILLYSVIVISVILIPVTSFSQISNFIDKNPVFAIIFLIMHSTISFALPYIFSTISLEYIDSGVASIVLSGAEPLAALLFGFLFYREIPTPLMFCGFILTVIAIMLLSRNENSKKQNVQ